MSPSCSIIIRSLGRPVQLVELLERLGRQRHRDFEIVVLDQTDDPALDRAVLALGDARIRLEKRPRLGAAGARNEAIRCARGPILLFIDDDDLPIDDDWVEKHLANYRDPRCMGVTGRLTTDPSRPQVVKNPERVRARVMSHTFFKDTIAYNHCPLRKEGITHLHGTNSSCRRSVCDRIGGWDEIKMAYGEEQSFAFKWARARAPGEYFVFDPEPFVWRRTDIPAGSDRRSGRDWYRKELASRVIFYHGIVGHYFPRRFRLLYPIYLVRTLIKMLAWIWDEDNAWHGLAERLRASLVVGLHYPALLWEHAWRPGNGAIRRVDTLEGG